MGSAPEPQAAVAPQQALPPRFTRSAAWPYFSFTASFMSSPLLPLIKRPLFADLNNVFRPHGFISSAAFGVEKLKDLLQRFGVCRVMEKRAFASHEYEVFIPQFVEMVRERGIRNVQLGLNFADDQAVWVGRQEELHDAEPGLRAHGRKHVGVPRDLIDIFAARGGDHISMFAEIRVYVNGVQERQSGDPERVGTREKRSSSAPGKTWAEASSAPTNA